MKADEFYRLFCNGCKYNKGRLDNIITCKNESMPDKVILTKCIVCAASDKS